MNDISIPFFDIDPNQLPPTVMSILAAKYDYQQSLFMRLEKTVDKEVNLLR
jgi:superfamily I DNA and/or RNA helicase